MQQTFTTTPEAEGLRLDRYLSAVLPDYSRSYLQRLIESGRVAVGGKPAKASTKLRAGQEVAVELPPTDTTPPLLAQENGSLPVVYEDQDVVVIDKPAGIVVHPAAGHREGTLVNLILGRWQGPVDGANPRPGIVHRLDKDTSGLMVVAKHPRAQAYLANQMKERRVVKRYLALVNGHLRPAKGEIEAPIARDPRDRKRMAVVAEGWDARTLYRVIEYTSDCTLVEATLVTGRTHQIRVHFKAIGHPIIGDPVYGVEDKRLPLSRQFLHACTLGFRLPSSREYIEFSSELPQDLAESLAILRGTWSGSRMG